MIIRLILHFEETRVFVRIVAAFVLMSVGFQVAFAAERPNFVFIITDDQSPETLSCYGNTVCQTPHLDQLAAEGIVLDDAHHMGSWLGAVCTCSRTMIMTGRTLWRIPGHRKAGVNMSKEFRQQAARESMPAVFNRAGYDTFRTCKRGNSFKEANAKFAVVKDATKRDGTPEGGSKWHGDQVMEYLSQREQTKDRDPFLIYFGFSHPHDPRNATPELAAKYGAVNKNIPAEPNPKSPPLPVNYLPAHPFHHGQPGLRDEEKVQGVLTKRDPATVRNETGREYACIENIDRQVGRVMKKLKAMGVLENTYVIYTADHGIAVGRHGLMGKQNLYEHTWRVPFIVRGPGIKAGSRASGYTYLHDVYPTLCDLAGIEAPKSVEGLSMRAVWEGKADRVRDVVFGCYCGGTKPGMRSIKTDGWKFVIFDVLDGKVREKQLFNLKQNPREFLKEHHTEKLQSLVSIKLEAQHRNLAGLEEYAAKQRELESLLVKKMKSLGDPHKFAQLRRMAK